MRHPILILSTVVLAVATAAALLSSAWLLSAPTAAEPAPADRLVVERFYAAINEAIATGDLTELRAVTVVDLKLIGPESVTDSGRTALEHDLRALHAADPGLRLTVELLFVVADRVAVRVAASRAGGGGAFLGRSLLAAPRPWGTIDLLRVRNGDVIELRRSSDGTGALQEVASASLELERPARRVLTLERFTLRPGDRLPIPRMEEPTVLLVEEGIVRVELGAGSAHAEVRDRGVSEWPTLAGDELFVVPARRTGSATNSGRVEATVTRLTMASPQPGGAAMGSDVDPGQEGFAHGTLAGGMAAPLPAGPIILAVGRVVLEPGATFSLAGNDGVVLIAVEAGEVTLAGDEEVWVRWASDGVQVAVAEASLAAADGALVGPTTTFSLQNDGLTTAEALVVILTPVEA